MIKKIKIKCKVYTRKKIECISIDELGIFHVYLKEAPEKGRANYQLINLIASHYKISKSAVTITAGFTTTIKYLEIIFYPQYKN